MRTSMQILEVEKIVFETIREYLGENLVFDTDKFVRIIITKCTNLSININKKGIEQIIGSLIKKRMIVERSTLSKEDVLINANRKLIYDYICSNPGKYGAQFIKDLNLSHHVIVWHLSVLEKFRFIKQGSFDNHTLYYDSKMNFDDVKINYLKSNNKKLLISLKQDNIGRNITQLSNHLGVHHRTLNKKLEILAKYNILSRKYIDNSYLYFLNEDKYDL